MKKTLFLTVAAMVLASTFASAKESMLIDFTQLKADAVADENGNPTENGRTVMDYSVAAGATFTGEQKSLMKTSLALTSWEVVLNSSAKNPTSVGLSQVVAAPVKESADVPFAGKEVMVFALSSQHGQTMLMQRSFLHSTSLLMNHWQTWMKTVNASSLQTNRRESTSSMTDTELFAT